MGMGKIGIVTFPLEKSNVTPLCNLTDIISHLTDQVFIVTGNAGSNIVQKFKNHHFELIPHTPGSNTVTRVYNYAKTQLSITLHMMKLSKNVDVWIFPIGGEALLPCMIFAKILRKSVIMSLTSSTESMMNHQQSSFTPIVVSFAKINYLLADRIILYSPALITEWNLEPYRHKILIAHRHFLDFNTFTVTTPLPDRPPLIGYIGRLSGEKGVQHFAQALPAILGDRENLRVLIGGDGQLKETIEATLQEGGVSARVDLPGCLNQLRLLVLPSYTEGLPNIMLEAMACGTPVLATPVLATPVGAIPDVIIDRKTRFIMENNSPKCIAANVVRALSSPDLERIAEDGRRFVEENFSFEKTVENWKRILQNPSS